MNIHRTRLPRFLVKFGFISQDQTMFGKVEDNVMSYKDVDFMLKLLSPFKYEEWIANISRCPRHGKVIINTIESNENGIKIMKGYLFQRI